MRGLDLELAAQDVPLEHRPRVVAAAPGQQGDEIGERPAELGGRRRDRVAAVDQAAPVGAGARVRLWWRELRFLVRRELDFGRIV